MYCNSQSAYAITINNSSNKKETHGNKVKNNNETTNSKENSQRFGWYKEKNTNWGFIIVLLVLVTAVGGYFAYRSQVKAVNATWNVKTQPPISNFLGSFPKEDGSQGWEGGTNAWIKIRANITEANKNNQQYCFRYKPGQGSTKFTTVLASSKTTTKSFVYYTDPDSGTTNIPVGGWTEVWACGSTTVAIPSDGYYGNACTSGKGNGGIKIQEFFRN